MDQERLDGIALIVQAIELTIAEVEAGDAEDRDERLRILGHMRELWRAKAAEELGA